MIWLTGITLFTVAQSPDRKSARDSLLLADIDRILRGQIDSNKIPGAVIEVKQGTRILCQQAYGWAQKYDFNHRNLAVAGENDGRPSF